VASAHTIEALIKTPPIDKACPFRWDELELDAPARISLATFNPAAPSDECREFDPVEVFKPGACKSGIPIPDSQAELDCEIAPMRGGANVAVQTIGPEGSGRYWSVGIAIDGPNHPFACLTASTVGFRQVFSVGKLIAPIQWFADLDKNGDRELILWHRLPWGSAEIENGMYPVAYVLDGTELVRRDDLAVATRARLAHAYRALLHREPKHSDAKCLHAVATALEHT